jgi:hypothetical protein
LDSFTCTAEDKVYYITNMFEYHGSLYLSGYSIPKFGEDEGTAGGRYDIAKILNEIYDKDNFDITNEELTPLVRENFTAVLLVCDSCGGGTDEQYTGNGAVGAALGVDDGGNLIWKVENITDTHFSPYTSSFTIGGSCLVYEYVFNESGYLLRLGKTGEVTAFRR